MNQNEKPLSKQIRTQVGRGGELITYNESCQYDEWSQIDEYSVSLCQLTFSILKHTFYKPSYFGMLSRDLIFKIEWKIKTHQ